MTDKDILSALNLEDASIQVQEKAVTQVRAIAEMRLMQTVEVLLGEENLREFSQLQESDASDKRAQEWLQEKLPQIDELRESIIKDYLAEKIV